MELSIKKRLDKLLIDGGYVMDFSNSSFQDFICESVNDDIYDEKYSCNGNSKGNRLRCFLSSASTEKQIKLSLDLLYYWDFVTAEKSNNDIKSYKICKNHFKKLQESQNMTIDTTIKSHININELTHQFINEQINKAKSKVKDKDYSGAITNSRTLVEQVLQELGKKLNINISPKDTLQKLFKEITQNMNIKITQDSSNEIKKIVSGLINIVDGLAPLRNSAGDAHARKINPAKHHALLAVNSSFTICEFLLESYEYQNEKNKNSTEGKL